VKTYPRANAQGQSVIVGSQWLSRNFICNGNSAYFWRKPVYTYFSGRIRVCSLDRWVSSLYASFDMLKQCVEMCMAYFSSKRKTRKPQSTWDLGEASLSHQFGSQALGVIAFRETYQSTCRQVEIPHQFLTFDISFLRDVVNHLWANQYKTCFWCAICQHPEMSMRERLQWDPLVLPLPKGKLSKAGTMQEGSYSCPSCSMN
jgi:hypothetical protein